MRTIEEAFNDVTNSVNSELLAGEAMYIEYRTTGKLSATRALDIGMRFYRRGIELDDAHGVVGPRSPRMTISLLTELARNGPEFVFREGSEFWLYEATPEQKKELFRRAREHQEEADNDDRS